MFPHLVKRHNEGFRTIGVQYFMRPEPKEDLGPIQTEYDELTGREMRWRYAKIGMVRNAGDNKRQVRVYLDPVPHLRIDKGKDPLRQTGGEAAKEYAPVSGRLLFQLY